MKKPKDSMYKRAYDVICRRLGCKAIEVKCLGDDLFLYTKFMEHDVYDRFIISTDAKTLDKRIRVPKHLLPSCMMCSLEELAKMFSQEELVVKTVLEACRETSVALPDKSVMSDWRNNAWQTNAAVYKPAIEKGTVLETLLVMADIEEPA